MKSNCQTIEPLTKLDQILVRNGTSTGARALNRSAFSVLELLVVSAILALLAGLILGALSRAKMAARRVACMSNLKEWGGATHLYANDNEDQLPREAAMDGINTW